MAENIDTSKYKQYLLQGEKIHGVYNLGLKEESSIYVILTTNIRIIIIKKFPKNLIDIDYDDIEAVEYYTNVDWLYAVYAFFLFLIGFLFTLHNQILLDRVKLVAPPLEPIISTPIFGVNAGLFIVLAAIVCVGLYFAGLFIISLFGKFRVCIYDQPPIDIVTALTPKIHHLIKVIDARKRKARKSRTQKK